jgi:hypothetical protein
MNFTIYKSVRSQKGEPLTAENFNKVTHDPCLKEICILIAKEPDHETQQRLKRSLPIVTWNASFSGSRKNELAVPSGAFMLDIDGIDNPYDLWCSIIGRRDELGILLAHKTPSTRGLRLVCKCRPELHSIDECQQWLAKEIGVEHDPACKDWARSSYMVPEEYIYYMDGKGLFMDEAEVKYEANGTDMSYMSNRTNRSNGADGSNRSNGSNGDDAVAVQHCFKGIPLEEIALEWLIQTGGEPVEGERNTRLYALAFELRCITDFNEATLLSVMPRYGLAEDEMRGLIHSACSAPRSKDLPKNLETVLQRLLRSADDNLSLDDQQSLNPKFPPLPPLFKQVVTTAPKDFKVAATLCLLPLVGTLASRLRAVYLDKKMHSPSFQVCLEAPQASGKSFISRMAEMILAPIIARDEEGYKEENEYKEKSRALGSRVSAEQRMDQLGAKPKPIVRFITPTISITKLLMRMENAQGLHLMAVAEEIDTVTKAFKRGFSNYSDMLRVAFDNDRYGQDYASDESFSGVVNMYYNTLFSGTPKAMRRFYPDVEDGTVSRVCFTSLPYRLGNPIPVWDELQDKDRAEVERLIAMLDSVSFGDGLVKPIHLMDLDWLNKKMELWLQKQMKLSVKTNDQSRDIFCRRASVVGFRAGMLAWFLYEEKDTPLNRRNTVKFAQWVASQMLNQLILRFPKIEVYSNVIRWDEVFRTLNNEFTRDELQRAIQNCDTQTPLKNVLSVWSAQKCIECIATDKNQQGQLMAVRFRKLNV